MASPILELNLDQIFSCETEAKNAYLNRFGNPPKEEDYLKNSISEYPNWLRFMLVSFCVLVLVFAFILSSMRVYDIGEKTFKEGIDHARSASVAGFSIVMLAEFSAILFTVAATVLAHSKNERKIFFSLACISISLAILGNAAVSFNHTTGSLISFHFGFKFIEAFAPSLFVFGASLGIEKIALNDIKDRRAAKTEYEKAYLEYRKNVTGFEHSPDYINMLATSIKNKIIDLNVLPSQKKVMNSIDDSTWYVIVKRVMDSRNWFNQTENNETTEMASPSHLTRIDVSNSLNLLSPVSKFSGTLSEIDGLSKQEKVRKFIELEPNHGLNGSQLAQLLGVSNATISNVLSSQNVLEEKGEIQLEQG